MVPVLTQGQVYRQNGEVSSDVHTPDMRGSSVTSCRTDQYPRHQRSKLLTVDGSSLILQLDLSSAALGRELEPY